MLLQTSPTPVSPPAAAPPAQIQGDLLSLVRRASFGYTTSDFTHAQTLGYTGWLDHQLDPASIDDSDLDALLVQFPSLEMDVETILVAYPPSMNGDQVVSAELRSARVFRATYSKRQLLERLVEFWTDHFNVTGTDGGLRYLKTVDDREVARSHAMGGFRSLLGASAHSGAMMYYLDNYTNRAGAPNENYARELMELHTLGTSGAFDENDVAEVARCFTGWTIVPFGQSGVGQFVFRAGQHDNGPKTVLGTSIPAGGGMSDGETVLDILASHPSTAERVSRKLCSFFLTNDPPQATVDTVAGTFLATGGDITATLRELLSRSSVSQVAVADALKLRRPLHLAVGALRSTGAQVLSAEGVVDELRLMGHAPFAWAAPNGYPDSIGAWGSNLLPRWGFMSRLLDGEVPGSRINGAALMTLLGGAPQHAAAAALDRNLTGGRLSESDVTEVQTFIDGQSAWNGATVRQSIALALSLPSAQWI